jgi:hypothetical protein
MIQTYTYGRDYERGDEIFTVYGRFAARIY